MTNSKKEKSQYCVLLVFSIGFFIFVFNIQQTIPAQESVTDGPEEQLAQVQIN